MTVEVRPSAAVAERWPDLWDATARDVLLSEAEVLEKVVTIV